MTRSTFRYFDLFSGIGGMRSAFDSVGGVCIASCERDRYARQTYAANFSVDHPFYEDIRDITSVDDGIRKIPDHDVLVAGFPCQPFSLAGVSKKNALGMPHGFACETQGTMFFEIANIMRVKRPKAFLLENVKNLISHDLGETFRIMLSVLRKQLGFSHVDYRIIDASPFVPQHRERVIIVGFREDAGFLWDNVRLPPAAKGPTLGAILHSQTEDPDGNYVVGPRGKVNRKYTLSEPLWNYLQKYAEKHRAAGNGFGFGLVGADDIARTLSARYHKDGSEILIDRGKRKRPRRLTPRECSRLMGFDSLRGSKFKIPVSDTQAYRQFGNSVAVPVIRAVAEAMSGPIADLTAGRARSGLPLFARTVA